MRFPIFLNSYFATARLLAAFLMVAAPFATAAGTDVPPERVVLSNKAVAVTTSDFQADLLRFSSDVRGSVAVDGRRVASLVNALLIAKALAREARAQGLDQLPVNQRAVSLAGDRVLAQLLIDSIEEKAAAEFEQQRSAQTARARELYQVNSDRYRVPEQVRASHVLVRTKDRSEADARVIAEKVRKEALSGVPFAELVARYSEDPGSKQQMGDLGFFSEAAMVKPFSLAAFGMKTPGDISEVVKTEFGYHVIQFTSRKPPEKQPFETALPAILDELRKKFIENARTEFRNKVVDDPSITFDKEVLDSLQIKLSPEALRQAGKMETPKTEVQK